MPRLATWLALVLITLPCLPPAPAGAVPLSWHDTKCERYRQAWAFALQRVGPEGIGPAFLRSHQAFLDSNCSRAADVCPRSGKELDLANLMVVLSMNAGTASTFPPFACR